MNDLEIYFRENSGRVIHKWDHYFEIYDRHFSKYRNKKITLLEFGVSHGGSLQMWKKYFGEDIKIYGVDINPHCASLKEDGIEIYIGDQENRKFLRSIANDIGQIDILIDDGGHTMRQQITTFEELYPCVSPDGIFLCEDTHTSYWKDWGGGHRKRGTFIEYAKNFVDQINAWHSTSKTLIPNEFTKTTHSVHFYDSVVVIEKQKMEKPNHSTTGTEKVEIVKPLLTPLQKLVKFLKNA